MIVQPGHQDLTTYVYMGDQYDGTPETGLTPTDFDLSYTRTRSACVKNDATAASGVDAAHSDNTVIEVDATNQPGVYRVDWPDAVSVRGAEAVLLAAKCAGCATALETVQIGHPGVEGGKAKAGTLSTTQMTTDITEATADHFNGRTIVWTGGALKNQAARITDYVISGGDGLFTFVATTEAPAANDPFIVV